MFFSALIKPTSKIILVFENTEMNEYYLLSFCYFAVSGKDFLKFLRFSQLKKYYRAEKYLYRGFVRAILLDT